MTKKLETAMMDRFENGNNVESSEAREKRPARACQVFGRSGDRVLDAGRDVWVCLLYRVIDHRHVTGSGPEYRERVEVWGKYPLEKFSWCNPGRVHPRGIAIEELQSFILSPSEV